LLYDNIQGSDTNSAKILACVRFLGSSKMPSASKPKKVQAKYKAKWRLLDLAAY